jgi:acetyl esterase/lipase
MVKLIAAGLAVAAFWAGTAIGQPVLDARLGPAGPPPGETAIPVYGDANPGRPGDEITTDLLGRELVLRNISYPTLTPVLPAPGKANGTAVIVAPGGGFMMLAMQNEGWRVARALADRGVSAFVLKYRLNPTPLDDNAFLTALGKMLASVSAAAERPPEIKDSGAGQDAVAALKLVRSRAPEWGVDPHRVGMIGFSAGAITSLHAVLEAGTDNDPATRAPDFFGYIYGPMNAVPVPADAPPMFAALAMDDPLFGNGDFSIASAWHAAKRPVELHVYQGGGHGFGLGQPGTTSTQLMPEFLAWMDMQGLLEAKAKP